MQEEKSPLPNAPEEFSFAVAPMLSMAINQPFLVPTFPHPTMFLCVVDSISKADRWYRWFYQRLELFRQIGKSYCDHLNIVLFPDHMPFANFLQVDASTLNALNQHHREVCRNARQAVTLPRDRVQAMERSINQAMTELQWLCAELERLRQAGGERIAAEKQCGLDERIATLQNAHQTGIEQFHYFMERLLSAGEGQWQQIREAGDHRRCALGMLLYPEDGELWRFRGHPTVRALDAQHKSYHGLVIVEAEIAYAMRHRGLSPKEQEAVEQVVRRRMVHVVQEHERLVQQIDAALRDLVDLDEAELCMLPAYKTRLPTSTLADVLTGIDQWDKRVRRFLETGEDTEIDHVLLHTTCNLGKRIDAAMSDPRVYSTQEMALGQIDGAHLRLHATGAKIVAFIREKMVDEAHAMIPHLERDKKNLVAHIRMTGALLGIDG